MIEEKERITILIQEIAQLRETVSKLEKSKSQLRHTLREHRIKETNYRTLLENLPQSIYYKDKNFRYVSCNGNFARSMRLHADEIIGKTDYDLFPLQLAERYSSYDRSVMESLATLEVEERRVICIGERIESNFRVPVMDENGHFIGILGIISDITERKQAEKTILEREEAFRLCFERANDAILWADPESGIITKCNTAAQKLLEMEKDELVGCHQSSLHPPENAEFSISMFTRHVLEQGAFNEESEIITKSGRIVPVRISASLTEVGGKRIMQGIFSDITFHRKAAEKLKTVRDEFLNAITHDMKSPLSSILGYLQLLASERYGPISPPKLNFLKMIRHSVDVLLSMINSMVGSSMIDSGELVYTFEDFLLKPLLLEIQEMFEALAIVSAINMSFKCPDDVLINGDRDKLRSVFYNLVHNALRYTPRDGLIRVSVGRRNGLFDIAVSNTGKGIAESDYERIFQKYGRAKGKHCSTGLGLYIARRYLEGHGSTIEVRSILGKETTFSFSLKSGIAVEGRRCQEYLVLFSGDDIEAICHMRNTLVDRGYHVDYVLDEKQTLKAIPYPTLHPSIVLVFRTMPDIDLGAFRAMLEEILDMQKISLKIISLLRLSECDTIKISSLLPLPMDDDFLLMAIGGNIPFESDGSQVMSMGSI
jgi:PAS domain S-box-containing protein